MTLLTSVFEKKYSRGYMGSSEVTNLEKSRILILSKGLGEAHHIEQSVYVTLGPRATPEAKGILVNFQS